MHAMHTESPIVIDDPNAAKALAHQTRLEILEFLHEHGDSTVTRLAEALGESTASVSYHISQLARFGFVVRSVGEGRYKPWRARNVTYTFGFPDRRDGSPRDGSHELVDAALERGARVIDQFLDAQESFPPEWQRAAVLSNRTCYVTAEELHDVAMLMLEHLDQYGERTSTDKPPGARPAHFLLRAVPGGATTDGATAAPTLSPAKDPI